MRPQYRRFGFVDFDAMAVLSSSEDADEFVCRRANGDNVLVTRADIIAGAGSVPDPLLLGPGTAGDPTYSFLANPDTGVFNVAADILGFAAGGVEIARAKETIGENQFIISPGVVQNNAAFPILAFGDGDSGFYENADDNLTLAFASQARWRWNSVLFRAVATDGPQLQNASGVSSTVPVILPVQSDVNTGLASDGFDGMGIICGGIQAVFFKESLDDITISTFGPILAPDGTGAAPSYSFTSDPNTGIRRVTADQLALVAGGLTCMSVSEIGGARRIGFYEGAPVALQTGVPVTTAALHAALVALRLITA